MAAPIYIVQDNSADAVPVCFVNDSQAKEVVLVSGPKGGGQPAFIVDRSFPGVNLVRAVGSARNISGTLTTYTNRVLALQPIAYWPLAETAGTVVTDESGHAMTASYNGGGGITLGVDGIGDGRPAATFSGADTSVSIGSAGFGAAWNGDRGSMIAWAKADSIARWSDGLVGWWFHVRASDDVNYNCVIGKISNNTIQWRRRSGGAISSVSKTVGSPTTWLFMAMTWDLAVPEIRAYDQDGLVGTSAVGFTTWAQGTHVPDSPNITVLAAGSLTLQEWFGQVAHCAAFNYVLSPSQISSLQVI